MHGLDYKLRGIAESLRRWEKTKISNVRVILPYLKLGHKSYVTKQARAK